MIFTEIEPSEDSFDFRAFQSLPTGRWQCGINQMLFGKYRVGLLLKGTGVYTVSYWGGREDSALYLCGFLAGICNYLPEQISQRDLLSIFPQQNDKDLSADFFNQLFKAIDLARCRFPIH